MSNQAASTGEDVAKIEYPVIGLITTCETEALLKKQTVSDCDIAILELEDGVLPANKVSARELALVALRTWDYGPRHRWVRINSVNSADGLADILTVAEGRPDALIPAKVRSPDEIKVADYLLTRREEALGLEPNSIKLVPQIESGPAVLYLKEIIQASPRVIAVSLGVEDLAVDVGYVRTDEGDELGFVRSWMVLVAHTLGVKCYDVSSPKLAEPDALYAEARRSYHLGFDGKKAVSPGQISVLRQAFSSSAEQIEWAEGVLAATERAHENGTAVYTYDQRMVDAPFVSQARSILARAASTMTNGDTTAAGAR